MSVARTVFIALLCSLTCTAQDVCTGSLGENLFPAGDFGSGTANIAPDPGIAPGYNYTANSVPPFDGSYVVTNNMGAWANRFGSWLPLRDNSSDPNGYFMVVNASFAPGLFYQQTIDNLCEGTVFEFSADLVNVVSAPTPNHILPNVNFVINGQIVGTSGDIPQNERWTTYRFLFTVPSGATSALLELVNNAPGGNGNDLGIDNISFRPCGPPALVDPEAGAFINNDGSTSLCENSSAVELIARVEGEEFDQPVWQWQRSTDGGATFTDIPGETGATFFHTDLSVGEYIYRFVVAGSPENLLNPNCRSVSEAQVVRVEAREVEFTPIICHGATHGVGNSTYTIAGVYVDSLISRLGCDSVITTRLTVEEDPGLVPGLDSADPTCDYLEDGFVRLTTPDNGTPPYRLTFAGAPVPDGFVRDNLPVGTYRYSVTDAIGCTTVDSFTLEGPPEFFVTLDGPPRVVLGEGLDISVQSSAPVANYEWFPVGISDCQADCERLTLQPVANDTVRLVATSAAGCVAEAAYPIIVQLARPVFLPSAISPNGDGINDVFFVFADVPAVERVEELYIFDRWGNQVFAARDIPANDPSLGWGGVAGEGGNYVYVTRIRFLDGAVLTYRGALTVVR